MTAGARSFSPESSATLRDDSRHDVVVTGIGAVSPFGWRARDLGRGLRAGRCAISEARQLDVSGHRTRIAGEVPPIAAELRDGFVNWRRWTRADRFAVVAASEAVEQAGAKNLILERAHRVGVFFGGSTAGMLEAEELFAVGPAASDHRGRTLLRGLAAQPLNSPGDAVARELGVCGVVENVSSACASGALALRAALDALRAGEVDLAIAGGADSLCQLTYAGFNSLRAVDTSPCRPFRHDRAGLSLGEGAGVLVLERLAHATARRQRALARFLGAGATCDAYHMTAPEPQGQGAATAMRNALDDAGLTEESVSVINAHGTGTHLNDSAELVALQSVFGARFARIALTSTKASIGHLLGSSGAIESVAVVLDLHELSVHPVPGLIAEAASAMTPNLVLERAQPLESGVVISTSLAFGGANAALVFATPAGPL